MNARRFSSTIANPASRRGGFASVTAIILLGLLGAAITALLAMIAADYRRTFREAENAQMRQMFLAATAQVVEQSHQWGDKPPTTQPVLPLPLSLKNLEASLETQVTPQPDGSVEVQMLAHAGKQASRQSLRFVKKEGTWSVGAIQLVQ